MYAGRPHVASGRDHRLDADEAASETVADTTPIDSEAVDVPNAEDVPTSADVDPMTDAADTSVSEPEDADAGSEEDVCVPQCQGAECGPDGCGGSCGGTTRAAHAAAR